jgi:hypothetical protein
LSRRRNGCYLAVVIWNSAATLLGCQMLLCPTLESFGCCFAAFRQPAGHPRLIRYCESPAKRQGQSQCCRFDACRVIALKSHLIGQLTSMSFANNPEHRVSHHFFPMFSFSFDSDEYRNTERRCDAVEVRTFTVSVRHTEHELPPWRLIPLERNHVTARLAFLAAYSFARRHGARRKQPPTVRCRTMNKT